MALGVLLIGVAMPLIDARLLSGGWEYPAWIETTTDAARTTLSAIVGAVMTVTGTVFSITIVTLSLTSQQYGPRLLRTFMHDLTTQLTLGVFLSTGLYCLLVLKSVDGAEQSIEAPHLSVALALSMGVLSMIMLIAFFHHIAMLIQAPSVIEAVAADLDDAIERLFPERIGDPPGDQTLAAAQEQLAIFDENSRLLRSRCEGYIQAIDAEGLLHWATEDDLKIRLRRRPGDFLCREEPLADLWGGGDAIDRIEERLNEAVIVGRRRTPRQDVECAVDELVEVAVRSLSPGINDPFTAVNCIDRLTAALARLAQRKTPSPLRCDARGTLRVVARPVEFTAVLDAALNQIRQNGRRSVAVTIRLLEGLAWVAENCSRPADCDAVLQQAEMTACNRDAFPEEADRRQIQERLDDVKAVLAKHRKTPAPQS